MSNPAQQQNQQYHLDQQKQMIKSVWPYDKRHCTDVCCVVIGIAFTAILFIMALVIANPEHIAKTSAPADSDGNVCGVDLPQYPFIYFTNPPDISKRVCVSKCPGSGDSKLNCKTTSSIGCKFNNLKGFEVLYYDNEQVNDNNGLFCMPKDETVKQQIITNGKLQARLVFFNSYYTMLESLLIAIGLSIVFIILVQCFPKYMIYGTVYAGSALLFILAVVLLLYKSNSKLNIVLSVVLLIVFAATVAGACMLHSSLALGSVFLEQSTRFSSKNPSTIIYIPMFMLLTFGFMMMLLKEYIAFVSTATPTIDTSTSLYYTTSWSSILFTMLMLLVQLIWGLFFLKESFNFCICSHSVNYYLGQDSSLCNIKNTFKLLFIHFGSLVGGSFINSFFLIPDMIGDFVRLAIPGQSQNCCTSFLDLVRSDAYAFIALTGNPFCNSAKYCEYLTNESLSSDGSQSSMRIYRICAHLCIVGITSILGLYIKGAVQPYTIAAIIVLGIFVCTFTISYHSDATEALLILFLLQEEFYKRHDKKLKNIRMELKADQEVFLKKVVDMHPNHQAIAEAVKELRQKKWDEMHTENEEKKVEVEVEPQESS